MTDKTQTYDIEDLRFLYDLSIYNCQRYGTFQVAYLRRWRRSA